METQSVSDTKEVKAAELEKSLRKIPQYTRNKRHFKCFIKHATVRKTVNLMIVEAERMLRMKRIMGKPYILIIDPTNICNLRCPLCPTGMGNNGRQPGKLGYECFTQIIDQLAPYAFEVNLHNWGEPLLNPDIFKMIEYAQSKNIGTNMSTNLNLIRDDDIGNIVRSGLENLSVSLDGSTNEVYTHYRRNGDFHAVLNNLRSLVETKKRLQRKTPFIEWQFIVMKHNVHQVEDARRIAGEIGVDCLRFIPVGLPFDEKDKEQLKRDWFPQLGNAHSSVNDFEYQFFQRPRKSACFYLYRSITVNPDGGVAPCCTVYGKENDFGEIQAQNYGQVWNNEHYQSARSVFSYKSPTVQTVCERCNIFKKPDWLIVFKEKIVRIVEVIIGLSVIVITLPVMAFVALIVKADSPGPVIFRQTRIGKNRRAGKSNENGKKSFRDARNKNLGGEPFPFYKFRTMYVDAKERFPELYSYEYDTEEIKTFCFKIPDDPRLTRFGSRLRKTTLDELPNLINLVNGDMSLVGPRPDIPEMIQHYEDWQRKKFDVKPGITGMAQANGRGLLSFQETLKRDVEYVEKKSLWLDIKIILKTVRVTFFKIGAF